MTPRNVCTSLRTSAYFILTAFIAMMIFGSSQVYAAKTPKNFPATAGQNARVIDEYNRAGSTIDLNHKNADIGGDASL